MTVKASQHLQDRPKESRSVAFNLMEKLRFTPASGDAADTEGKQS